MLNQAIPQIEATKHPPYKTPDTSFIRQQLKPRGLPDLLLRINICLPSPNTPTGGG